MVLSETKPRAPTVLIADDDEATRLLLVQCFKTEGFTVVTASDGVEACSTSIAENPDVVLLDLLLPRRDGYTVLLHFRAREATRNVPVVILSAESGEEHAEISRTLGAQAFVTKPFTPSGIVATVRELLSKNPGAVGA
jgi:DNA-binding response OmpR family regulator